MRRNLLVAALVGVALSLGMWGVDAAQEKGGRPARADGAVVPSAGSGSQASGGQVARPTTATGSEAHVALVDVAYVFKNYDKFNRNYEAMKKEVKQREQEIVDAQTELKNLMAKQQQFTPDSTNFKQLDQQLIQKKTELELLAKNSRAEFTQKEAGLYHQTYQEVEAVVRTFAERNGITLVLRASRDDDGSSSNPQEVIKEVSQQVIYAVPKMDITEQILATLNAKSPSIAGPKNPNTKPTGPTNTAPSQPPKTTDKQDSNKPTGGTIKK